MPRITLDIELAILKEVKALQKKEGRSLRRIISQLLAEALARRKEGAKSAQFEWISRPMHALVNLSDKEAIHAVLEKHEG